MSTQLANSKVAYRPDAVLCRRIYVIIQYFIFQYQTESSIISVSGIPGIPRTSPSLLRNLFILAGNSRTYRRRVSEYRQVFANVRTFSLVSSRILTVSLATVTLSMLVVPPTDCLPPGKTLARACFCAAPSARRAVFIHASRSRTQFRRFVVKTRENASSIRIARHYSGARAQRTKLFSRVIQTISHGDSREEAISRVR